MSNDIDEKIKLLLNSNESLTVPKKISLGINETLKQIQNNKRKTHLKRISIAASLIMATTIGLGAIFPALAENIPLINKIIGDTTLAINYFEINNFSELENLQVIDEHTIPVNRTIGNITVIKFAYDGIAFYSTYEISNTSFNERYNYGSSVFVKDTEYIGQFYFPEMINDTTVRVTQVYPMPYPGETIPSEFLATLKFTKDNTFYNELETNFNSNENLLLQNTNQTELNREIVLGSNKAKLISITQSESYVALVTEYDIYEPADRFVLLDTNGTELEKIDMGGIIEKDSKTIVTNLYKPTKNANVARILVVEEKNKILSPVTIKNKDYLDLSTQLPAKITVGKDKTITVIGVTEDIDTYKVILQAKDIAINSYIQVGGLALYDPSKSKNKNNSYYSGRAIPLGEDSYMLVYYKVNEFNYKNPELSFGSYDELINILYEFNVE